jgi:hypothetical protein
MNVARWYGLSAVFVGVLAPIGAVRWHGALPVVQPSVTTLPNAVRAGPSAAADSLFDDAEDLMVSNDPFRLANEPAAVRYDPQHESLAAGASAPPPAPIRPKLVLKAIVGGPPWQAIVDGIPGQPSGTIVRAGSTFDKLTTRAVTQERVVIQGPDTTWTLSFRKPIQ